MAQALQSNPCCLGFCIPILSDAMAMTKGALMKQLATDAELKTKQCSDLINNLVAIATKVKKTGVFAFPGLCRIKIKTKPATKAGVRNIFGKDVKVAAKPAKKVVKAYPVAVLKKQI